MDSDSELEGGGSRTDGTDARVFSQAVYGAGGYIPRHKEPPRYIRTKTHNKKTREFNRMFLAQELVTAPRKPAQEAQPTDGGGAKSPPAAAAAAAAPVAGDKPDLKGSGAIWASEFSQDGRFFAAGGRDRVVRVWAVISTPEERKAHEDEEALANGGTAQRLSAPVFRNRPVMEFEGHTGEVLDLSWSKNNFLLSSSMDKTVRLWHMSRKECLCTFKHKDLVTKLAFHPVDDRFFLAGSLDTMLRLWSIPDKSVAYSVQLPAFVTAVAFCPDGRTAIAGLLNGLCMFYNTDGLKYQSQIHVRSSRGKNAKGSKITGIQTMVVPSLPHRNILSLPSSPQSAGFPPSRTSSDLMTAGEIKVLISSNDSRVRIYNLREKTLDVKFKGHENTYSQISASFSDDGKYVISGSEDCKACIWSVSSADSLIDNKDKRPCEYFDAHSSVVTTSRFAPAKTRQLLSQSGDPIYDLCNPPPVKLMSLEEAAHASGSASQAGHASEYDHPPSTPSIAEAAKRAQISTKKSDAYLMRSAHSDGNIIVTTDDNGVIKVFRQDCAYLKRKHDSWETGSGFSRKLAGTHSGFGLGRTGSILTRTSASSAAHSRRGSLSQPTAPAGIGSPQLGAVILPPGSSDRILSWRQDIEHGENKRASSVLSGGTPTRSERSLSPSKAARSPLASNAATLAIDARRPPYAASPSIRRSGNQAALLTRKSADLMQRQPAEADSHGEHHEKDGHSEAEAPISPPLPSFTYKTDQDEEDLLRLDPAGASYSFWNFNRWKGIASFRGSVSGPSQGGPPGHTHSISEVTPSAKKTRNAEGSADEDENAGAKKDRRQSLHGPGGTATTAAADGAASRRRTMSPGRAIQAARPFGGQLSTIPTIELPDETEDERHGRLGSRELSPQPTLSSRGHSVVSRLSSELSSNSGLARPADTGQAEMCCFRCGSTDFKLKKVTSLMGLGRPREALSCGRCGQQLD